MARTDTSKQVVVVGAGLTGLATAAYLARAGHRVTVLERAARTGGLARTTERGGVLHNMGPHAFFRDGAGEAVLRELGVTWTGRSPSGAGVTVRHGRTSGFPRNTRTLLTSRLFGLRDRAEAGAQLMRLRSASPETMRGRTFARYLREDFAHDTARDFVAALVRLTTYTHAPELIDMADVMSQMQRGGFDGVTYIDGGWQSLVRGLEEAAAAAGAQIRTGVPADHVEPGPGAAVILRDGGRVDAGAVVLAVSPAVAASLLPVEATRLWAGDAIPARTACLDVTLRALPRPRRLFGLAVGEPVYLSVHTKFARLAPTGLTTVSVARYLAPEEAADAGANLIELEQMLGVVQPGWRDHEVDRQFLPEMTAATALPRADRGGIPGRPGPAVPGAEGVFVAGDWVGPDGWLADAALGSARRAAREAAGWLAASPGRVPALAAN